MFHLFYLSDPLMEKLIGNEGDNKQAAIKMVSEGAGQDTTVIPHEVSGPLGRWF